MKHTELRDGFLEFFRSKDHRIVTSDSLVPAGDPTLLFTSAGMNQFKEEFLGNVKDFRRAASCQKCLRTPDLENVGKTAYHHTFFEMLGNFSFGGYFKDEAITWAWEFMRDILKIPDEKMWASVYIEDDEAYNIWKEKIALPPERIVKLGQKENFWPSEAKDKGPNGPCGPCSEIFFDYGEGTGCGRRDCSPACGCGRFVEVWNLVFTQFNRKDAGFLEPLPNRNIDTGMGLERLCSVMQGVKSNFQTDLFAPIIKAIEDEISREKSQGSAKEGIPPRPNIYAIADHIRAVSFAICDGVTPSNEERGYVIRNLIRKSAVHARNLGIEKPFLYKLVYTLGKIMEKPYPEVLKRHQDISLVIKSEEERFSLTLKEGKRILRETIEDLKRAGRGTISGDTVFKLFDTHGLPVLIIKEMAQAEGLGIDEEGFDRLMHAQREQSRKTSKLLQAIFVDTGIKDKTEFIGYQNHKAEAKVLRIFTEDGKELDEAGKNIGRIEVILEKSVFYGEAGGQAGDSGWIRGKGLEVSISDAKKLQDAIILEGEVKQGRLKKGDTVGTCVDTERRLAIAKNHTATHLLQAALRKVLGEHVQQQGSYVGDGYLRFDFTHFKAMTKQEMGRVEELVNEYIKRNSPVEVTLMDLAEAKRTGALAFFGERYDQGVRVVSVGDYSKELCGGTHLENTSEIGLFKIVSEGSTASGIRRIEAVTGEEAYRRLKEQEALLTSIAQMLECKPEQILQRCERLLADVDAMDKRLAAVLARKIEASIDAVISKAEDISGVKLLITKIEGADADILKRTADMVKGRLDRFAALLASVSNEKINLLLAISPDLVKKGLDAGKLIGQIAKIIGGSGGGKPDMASGGAKDIERTDYLLKEAKAILTKEIQK